MMLKGFLSLFQKEGLLDQALSDTRAMFQDTERMVRAATQALRRSDSTELDLDVPLMDKAVNRYESEVRRKVFTHLTVIGSENIYPSLVLVSIIIDVERVGDYAKNIVELASQHAPKLRGGVFETELQRIEAAVVDELLPRGRVCFESRDETAALALIREMDWVNPACDRITNLLCSGGEDCGLPANTQVTLALYVRYLKRINSHWLNVLTSVVSPFDRIGFRKDI
jgi:phosphate transport system protein